MNSLDTDWVMHPSETAISLLQQRGSNPRDLVACAPENTEWAENFLLGIESINASTAPILARELGGTSDFWLQLQTQYDSDLKRLMSDAERGYADWVSQFDYRDIAAKSWLPPTSSRSAKLGYLLGLFGVSDLSEWDSGPRQLPGHVAYRQNGTAKQDEYAVSAWIALAHRAVTYQSIREFDHKGALDKVPYLRSLVFEADIRCALKSISDTLSSVGIHFVLQDAPRGCYASGAVVPSGDGRPLMILTRKYKTDDQFWFSFFHELGHVLLHNWKEGFIDSELGGSDGLEKEANAYAQHLLFPMERLNALAAGIRQKSLRQKARLIFQAAKDQGVPPGIVVGQLQHHGAIPFSHFNKMKNKIF